MLFPFPFSFAVAPFYVNFRAQRRQRSEYMRSAAVRDTLQRMTPQNNLKVNLQVAVQVNGAKFSLTGESNGVPGSGNISAIVKTIGEVPNGFSLSLLSYVLLTGQPVMSFTTEGVVNPFQATGGVYNAIRTLDLQNSGRLVTTYSVAKASDGLLATFDVRGSVNVPTLSGIEPTVETWVPVRAGVIEGRFLMVWRTADGQLIQGEAATTYFVGGDVPLQQVQFRSIQIDVHSTDKELRQTERIVLFGSPIIDRLAKT